MEAQKDRFALVATVLPEASVRILATPDKGYKDLSAAILVAHKLIAFQKAREILLFRAPIGDRRPP